MVDNEFVGLPDLDRALIAKILNVLASLNVEDLDLTGCGLPCGTVTASSLAALSNRRLVQLLDRLYIAAEDSVPEAGRTRFPTDLSTYGRNDGRRPANTSRFSHQDIAERSG